ncbi:hypothetical protein BaOVIS_029640 [Babesia ovis]|uniref:Uncharacterized protein n=1 Tax=Babesia ovis TaxID=5869 RepID=A0A9W5WVY7_BABOV|nr:hypothetical protein BaOVIS_029640 [Babesia ovis]
MEDSDRNFKDDPEYVVYLCLGDTDCSKFRTLSCGIREYAKVVVGDLSGRTGITFRDDRSSPSIRSKISSKRSGSAKRASQQHIDDINTNRASKVRKGGRALTSIGVRSISPEVAKTLGDEGSQRSVISDDISAFRESDTDQGSTPTARGRNRFSSNVRSKQWEELLESELQSSISKISPYVFDNKGIEFSQSYVPASSSVMGLGTLVTPTRNELKMCNALSDLGDKECLLAFERTMYQSSILRSRAFSLSWGMFMQRVNDIIRTSVDRGAKSVIDLLKYNKLSGNLLQVILADVGVALEDKKPMLDILIGSMETLSPKEHILIKVNTSTPIQAILEHIYLTLKGCVTHVRSQQEGQVIDAAIRKTILEQIVQVYRSHSPGAHLVLIIDTITHNLSELLFTLQLLKTQEGLMVSCILCANCWQTNLEQHVSMRVYSGLSILNCDVLSVNKVADEILNILLFDSAVQSFVPHFHSLEKIWDTLYDEEMSIIGLIKRVYYIYECFYRNSQLSFVCMPNMVNIFSKVRTLESEPFFEVEQNDDVAKELLCKLSLLFCASNLSESHCAYLQLLLDKDASVEALCLQLLPREALKLTERRISLQLGILLLQKLMVMLPNCDRARGRLSLLTKTLCSEHAEMRVNELTKRLSRTIQAKHDRSLVDIVASLKEIGSHFLSVYPTVASMMSLLGTPPKHDLVCDYLVAIRPNAGSTAVSVFVEHALTTLLLPTVQSSSRLAHHMVMAKFRPLKAEWNIMRDMLANKESAGFTKYVKELLAISQMLPTRTVNLWDMFCLFYAKFPDETISRVFIRFVMAIETACHILGYFTMVVTKTTQPVNAVLEPSTSTSKKLIQMIKARLSRLKMRRIHLGRNS